jgi:hypothetical protein
VRTGSRGDTTAFVQEVLYESHAPGIGLFDATFDGAHIYWFERAVEGGVRLVVDGLGRGQPFDALLGPAGEPFDPVAASRAGQRREQTGRRIVRVPEPDAVPPIVLGAGGRRFAFVGRRGRSWFVSVDGLESFSFHERPHGLAFSPGGRHVVFLAEYHGRTRVFFDRELMPQVGDWVVQGVPAIAPDGEHLAYVAAHGHRRAVVIDDAVDREFGAIVPGWPRFGPAGQLAYVATTRERPRRRGEQGAYELVVDGEIVDRSEMPQAVAFSPDGLRVAFVAGSAQAQQVVVDGREGPVWRGVSAMAFSPDGERFAYAAVGDDGGCVVVLDGEPVGPPCEAAVGLAFSPDGRRFAYVAQRRRRWTVVLDGEPGEPYDVALAGTFAPDGRFAYAAARGSRGFVVVDRRRGPEFDAIVGPVAFAPRRGQPVYVAERLGRSMVVVDHHPGPPVDALRSWTVPERPSEALDVFFGGGGEHVAYSAMIDGRAHPVVDGHVGGAFDVVGPPVFSDGRVAFACLRGRVVSRCTLDLPR